LAQHVRTTGRDVISPRWAAPDLVRLPGEPTIHRSRKGFHALSDALAMGRNTDLSAVRCNCAGTPCGYGLTEVGADCGLSPQVRNRKGSSKKADAQGIDQFFLSCKRSEGRQLAHFSRCCAMNQ